uniref:Cell growth regulator with RING finger domain protein 1 n=1 Tax=Bos mutus grunniens TaxID=30521 RepID=A0A8B9YTK7_BOSMU
MRDSVRLLQEKEVWLGCSSNSEKFRRDPVQHKSFQKANETSQESFWLRDHQSIFSFNYKFFILFHVVWFLGETEETGITLTTDCLEDSLLTCYWGCSVQKLYEALQKHFYCFRISTPRALEDALYSEYLYQEQYFIKKDSKEEIYCQLPRDTKIEDFGTVPRSRYPLVALLTLADKDDREIYDIISMVSVIHIPDKTYKLSCRILYQYLLLAQGQFHDLKQLFMSANNNSTPSSNSSPEEKNTDRSLLEKAGLSESEVEPPEENSKDCVVCQNGTVNWVLLPCRHTCLCDGCVKYFQQCPMCRQFVQESFALCSQKEQDKDKLKSL